MMFLKGGGIGGILLIVFLVWIFLSSSPEERIVRACKPIEWTGNVFQSIEALIFSSSSQTISTFADNFTYGCQYSIWRLFYEEDYKKASDESEAPDNK